MSWLAKRVILLEVQAKMRPVRRQNVSKLNVADAYGRLEVTDPEKRRRYLLTFFQRRGQFIAGQFIHSFEILTGMDFRHSMTVWFPNSWDFRHCLKFEPKFYFSDT